MKHRAFLMAILLAASIAGAASDSRAQTADAVDGKILHVECAAQIEKNGTRIWRPLHYPQDIGLPLMDGDQVKCVGAGYMEVLVPEGPRRIVAPQVLAIQPDPQDNEIVKQLRGFGIAGASRGNAADSRILWPSKNSVVMPEHFNIRWAPVPQKIVLSIMSEAKDVTLWGPAEVDGAVGSLKSDAVSSALAAYKTKPGSLGLILTLTLANTSDWEEVHFSFLNGRQEQELNAQLDFWEKHTEGLALRLGRGYSFARHKLFAEAAEEYDSALNAAPESRYLLEDAIQANRLAGRASRVKELQTRLASQPQATTQ
jgi:hypothetical protein